MPTKAERIGDGHIDPQRSCYVGRIVQVARLIGCLQPDGRGDDAMLHGQCRGYQFDGSCGTQHMPCHGFGRADGRFTCLLFAQGQLQCQGLGLVVERCRCAVSIDIELLARLKTGLVEGLADGS